MAKIIRVLVYEGSALSILNTFKNNAVQNNGRKKLPYFSISSIITTVEDVYCTVCYKNRTNNTSLICDNCLKLAKEESERITENV